MLTVGSVCTSADLELRAVVREVADSMDAHCAGVEGMEVSAVAVWERVLRSALSEVDEELLKGGDRTLLVPGDVSLRFAARTVVDDIVKQCAGRACGPAGQWHHALLDALYKAYEMTPKA